MKCQAVVEQIIAQSGRTAPPPEVESHLWSCPACSKVYLEQQALWRQMDAWEAPEISAGFDRQLFARIGRRVAEPWWGLEWMRRWFQPLQPAFPAALAGILFIAAIVAQPGLIAPAPDAVSYPVSIQAEDARQIDRALDDIQMLADFEILPVAPEEEEERS